MSVPLTGRWVRGPLPDPEPSELELLRVEFLVPPATSVRNAQRDLTTALRKVAEAVQLPSSPPHQLRQVQLAHGAAYALLGVPRGQALQWLRGSGCGGLYLRPFWTASTRRAVAREDFSLLWLRGRIADGPRL